MKRETIFSSDRKYRYTLWRDWSDEMRLLRVGYPNRYVQFIGLNPSTADETQDDPTIRRCINFAKAWGYGAFCMTNLFAYRATDPQAMKSFQYPIGEHSFCAYEVGNMNFSSRNMAHIYGVANGAGLVVAAWGTDGNHLKQQDEIRRVFTEHKLPPLHHLGLNGDHTPKHPLYLKKTTTPTLWN